MTFLLQFEKNRYCQGIKKELTVELRCRQMFFFQYHFEVKFLPDNNYKSLMSAGENLSISWSQKRHFSKQQISDTLAVVFCYRDEVDDWPACRLLNRLQVVWNNTEFSTETRSRSVGFGCSRSQMTLVLLVLLVSCRNHGCGLTGPVLQDLRRWLGYPCDEKKD